MAGSWGTVLTGLVPLGLVISLSPLTVIPAVLVLQAPRPRPSSLAFLGGWLLSLAALTALAVAASHLLGGLDRSPPRWSSWLRVVLGAGLIGYGIFRWHTRRRHSESPAWMRSFASITPARAGITGAVLAVVRPDVALICVPAGLAIGSSGLGPIGDWMAALFFVAVAASSVAIPILAYLAAGSRLDDALARLRDWMDRNNAALLAAVLVVIGAMVLYHGIDAL
ncbi:GAP family protein [Mycobacterium avium subsp. hominissuis]|uniref:GAP family protein n=2 Tax=Mycobacterium avium TaxID=1764 RepID=A0A2A3L6S2_MYCAV|nr:GAP family protein [Mycobacterium avium]APA78032.1 GAP family protein [Mycobacterium avium subsp. hominissuis]ATO64659.2 GAP family protein [Mycobacterium avium subsp. hominissuis]ATO69222.1 GAP family protein [Mycobacterium avium subsp. hominissuis]ATO73753.1 GAP family protein [Mycobacterium avium subsp. hominissuis]MBZ4561410.1 GAP family protein [Mycobacterium avium subsp. hominissuis]